MVGADLGGGALGCGAGALPEVLRALLGVKNCDWKWSIELVLLMVSDIDTWDNVLRPVADQIVQSA
ncbi:hypothetical protein [Streptomyces cyaneofuscatus]|uniref:hypothetical protein n=1 Tax=Streptomyces cyaneofuscatus TaxID=66883 RepID=UPI00382BECE8